MSGKLEFWVEDEGSYKYTPKNEASAKLCGIYEAGLHEESYRWS